ncbi:MAG: hypothetical protein OEV34_17455, partial [Gammaproteobacteria bacterium]|nr:hypothetical protein [Gammaproteobacteria bacterium]
MEKPNDGIAGKLKHWLRKALKALLYLFAGYVGVIALVIWVSGDDDYEGTLHDFVVNDITELNPIPMSRVFAPQSVDNIVSAIQSS